MIDEYSKLFGFPETSYSYRTVNLQQYLYCRSITHSLFKQINSNYSPSPSLRSSSAHAPTRKSGVGVLVTNAPHTMLKVFCAASYTTT